MTLQIKYFLVHITNQPEVFSGNITNKMSAGNISNQEVVPGANWCKYASKLLGALQMFDEEKETFYRLMYKNKNQHRSSIFYHRLDHVRRLTRRIDEFELSKMFWSISCHTIKFSKNQDQEDFDFNEIPERISEEILSQPVLNLPYLLFQIHQLIPLIEKVKC